MIIWARIYGIFTRVTIKIHHSWNIHLARLWGAFFGTSAVHQHFHHDLMATGENTWFAVPYPEPHVSLNFIPIGIGSMYAISFTCIYLMFVWNLGVYVYTIHGSYEIGFYRIFTKHVVLALSGPSLFCKPSTTQHMWPVVICPQHVAAQASLFWQFRWGHLALFREAGWLDGGSLILRGWSTIYGRKSARWASTSYKWSCNPYKWCYKRATGVIILLIGLWLHTYLGRGPSCIYHVAFLGVPGILKKSNQLGNPGWWIPVKCRP